MNAPRSNVEHREVYEYDLIKVVISEAGTNYDPSVARTKS